MGISNVESLKDLFRQKTLTWRENLISIFCDLKSFDVFASGLNGIHGDVHIATGGGLPNGNMSLVESAGLDPIFFLYHTYVIHPPNRLLALNLAELDSDR